MSPTDCNIFLRIKLAIPSLIMYITYLALAIYRNIKNSNVTIYIPTYLCFNLSMTLIVTSCEAIPASRLTKANLFPYGSATMKERALSLK